MCSFKDYYIGKEERSQINYQNFHIKKIEKEKQTKSKSRCEIIKKLQCKSGKKKKTEK